jgi:hypothetical protein
MAGCTDMGTWWSKVIGVGVCQRTEDGRREVVFLVFRQLVEDMRSKYSGR